MSHHRPKDTTLASTFTPTTHAKATPPRPVRKPLPKPLNVLIIGASRGIGEHIAYAYAHALSTHPSSHLILAARESSSAELAAVAQRARACARGQDGVKPSSSTTTTGTTMTITVTTLSVDITSSPSVACLAASVKDLLTTTSQRGGLDVVVLNSGYSGPVVLKVHEGNPQDFQDVFDVNVQGTYLVAHYFIPLLRDHPGGSSAARTFIVVNSFAACIINGHIANTAYCVSKFAQARLVEFLAEQYGGGDGEQEQEGVLAIAVHPGAVNTEMADKTTPESFRPYLTDDVGLCGAFCVWLSRERRMWLSGRLLGATWDVDEFLAKKGKIEEQDLLKFSYRVGDASNRH
ncbi:hypothetical protein N0V83_007491 [Neocucurbitaria cava]|uniref:NAD(P)-binding protein n=1 Tax=Neocucurbitaria cava TaxID=798079 RepID=A0A9W8Y6H2_9PLEO|nr:hypothetical protein N0V83_007491 [Neocucurbitaria cava]